MSNTVPNTMTVSRTATGILRFFTPSMANGSATYTLKAPPGRSPRRVNKNVESAVYAHIQAMRALGKTRTDTSEIARALGLTLDEVDKTMLSLTKKGVKVVNG